MPISRFDKVLPITGVIAGLLALVGLIPTGPDTPDDPKVITYLADHQGRLMIAGFAGALFCVAMLFFATAIRQALRSGEPGEGSYSSVAYAGAVLVALSGVVNGQMQLAAVDAAHRGHSDSVRTLAYIGEFGWMPWVAASAAMMLGAGLGGLRTSVLPKWLSVASVLLGVLCLLGPTGVIVFFLQPLWFISTGIVLYRRLNTAAVRTAAVTLTPAGV